MSQYKIIDTHAHLFSKEIINDSIGIIDRAKKSGIEAVLMPNIDLSTVDSMLEMCRDNKGFLFPMIGLHPCHVEETYKKDLNVLEKYLETEELIGIGELGLDLYHETKNIELQKEALKIQLEWAKNLHLPISLHFRSAFDEAYQIIKQQQDGRLKGVFHCFSGTVDEAKKIIDLGFHLGIGGVLTFKNCILKETLKNVSLEHIVLETDSPYLAPVPFRGKNNEPAFLLHVLNILKDIYEKDAPLIADTIYNTTVTIFDKIHF